MRTYVFSIVSNMPRNPFLSFPATVVFHRQAKRVGKNHSRITMEEAQGEYSITHTCPPVPILGIANRRGAGGVIDIMRGRSSIMTMGPRIATMPRRGRPDYHLQHRHRTPRTIAVPTNVLPTTKTFVNFRSVVYACITSSKKAEFQK